MAEIKTTYRTNNMKLHGEIRKVEELDTSFKLKDGTMRESKAILLKVDDDDEERIELVDKCSDNIASYKKGMTGTFTLGFQAEKKFGTGKYEVTMLVIGFKEDEE